MQEQIIFHFEGGLADEHRMNFYESARFQYAAARLLVKLEQFRNDGKFVKNITNRSNVEINILSHTSGSFNINIENISVEQKEGAFINVPLSDLIAFASERIVEKIDENTLKGSVVSRRIIEGRSESVVEVEDPGSTIDQAVAKLVEDETLLANLPEQTRNIVRRRASEKYREKRLAENQAAISRIDLARSQKLIGMSAPLVREMATALRESADTLEIVARRGSQVGSVLFLDRALAQQIEVAAVEEDITLFLGDITQFNKDNGWGKVKIESGLKVVAFSVPSDILPVIRSTLIKHMDKDAVYLQTYIVRDRGGELSRLIVVGVLPTPAA